jgi:hypothetical protein
MKTSMRLSVVVAGLIVFRIVTAPSTSRSPTVESIMISFARVKSPNAEPVMYRNPPYTNITAANMATIVSPYWNADAMYPRMPETVVTLPSGMESLTWGSGATHRPLLVGHPNPARNASALGVNDTSFVDWASASC